MDTLILVDRDDNEIGYEEKEKCHIMPAKLHRALSVFLFNDKGEILLTKRSGVKKTWPNYWSNACCSHPRKGEKTQDAAERRTMEELGIKTPVEFVLKFEYSAKYDKDWGEHELDHVFVGKFNGKIDANKDEITDWKFISINELRKDIEKNPGKYTPWFKMVLDRVINYAEENDL